MTSILHDCATKVFNQIDARCNTLKLLKLPGFNETNADEHAFMLSTAASLATYDTHIFICRPY